MGKKKTMWQNQKNQKRTSLYLGHAKKISTRIGLRHLHYHPKKKPGLTAYIYKKSFNEKREDNTRPTADEKKTSV